MENTYYIYIFFIHLKIVGGLILYGKSRGFDWG